MHAAMLVMWLFGPGPDPDAHLIEMPRGIGRIQSAFAKAGIEAGAPADLLVDTFPIPYTHTAGRFRTYHFGHGFESVHVIAEDGLLVAAHFRCCVRSETLFDTLSSAERAEYERLSQRRYGRVSARKKLIRGEVVSVVDGDTLQLRDRKHTKHWIHLLDIDAPELGQKNGTSSRNALVRSSLGRKARVIWWDVDKDGRILGTVYLDAPAEDGATRENLNLQHVAAGWAWTTVARKPLVEAELAARQARLGLWQDSHPVPPWRYRVRQADRRRAALRAKARIEALQASDEPRQQPH